MSQGKGSFPNLKLQSCYFAAEFHAKNQTCMIYPHLLSGYLVCTVVLQITQYLLRGGNRGIELKRIKPPTSHLTFQNLLRPCLQGTPSHGHQSIFRTSPKAGSGCFGPRQRRQCPAHQAQRQNAKAGLARWVETTVPGKPLTGTNY